MLGDRAGLGRGHIRVALAAIVPHSLSEDASRAMSDLYPIDDPANSRATRREA